MKVYDCPKHLPAPQPDWENPNWNALNREEIKHTEDLKQWLKANGYPGKNTGETIHFGVADGHAVYMMAEGKKSCLIHLPYGDGYSYRDVTFLPKAEILRRIKQHKELHKLLHGE